MALAIVSALLLHLLLSVIPISSKQPQQSSPRLQLTLQRHTRPSPAQPTPPIPSSQNLKTEPEVSTARDDPQTIKPQPSGTTILRQHSPPPAASQTTTVPSLEQLRAQARQLVESESESDSATQPTLGTTYISELPSNWNRPILQHQPTRFAQYWREGSSKIIDEWTEPGGVAKRKIRLANGEQICGELPPVDILDPFAPRIWSYYLC